MSARGVLRSAVGGVVAVAVLFGGVDAAGAAMLFTESDTVELFGGNGDGRVELDADMWWFHGVGDDADKIEGQLHGDLWVRSNHLNYYEVCARVYVDWLRADGSLISTSWRTACHNGGDPFGITLELEPPPNRRASTLRCANVRVALRAWVHSQNSGVYTWSERDSKKVCHGGR